MAKGKRMLNNHSNKSKSHKRYKEEEKFHFKSFFIIFLIILILAVLIFLAYKYMPIFINKNTINSSEFTSASNTNITNVKTVEGLNSVSITGINISTSNKDSSIIEIHFSNTSNKNTEETKVHFYALGSEGNIIFGMPLTIPEIPANSETTYRVLCTSNLSEVKDYKISIE